MMMKIPRHLFLVVREGGRISKVDRMTEGETTEPETQLSIALFVADFVGISN